MKQFFEHHENKIDVVLNAAGLGALMYTAGSGAAINVAICFLVAVILISFNYYHGYWRGLKRAEGEADTYFGQAKEALEKASEFRRAARDMLDATRTEARTTHSLIQENYHDASN